MPIARRRTLSLATVVSAALLVPTAPAHAAYPSTSTTYKQVLDA
jgi:hypothetical protein